MKSEYYEFDRFALCARERSLFRHGERISLQPKVFDLLLFLISRNGETVSRDELMAAVWPDSFVEETNLRFCIHALRKALGKKSDGSDFVETFPKRGYRFSVSLRTSPKMDDRVTGGDPDPAADVVEDAFKPKPLSRRTRMLAAIAVGIVAVIIAAAALSAYRLSVTPQDNPERIVVLPFRVNGENLPRGMTSFADFLIPNLEKLRRVKIVRLNGGSGSDMTTDESLEAARKTDATALLTGSIDIVGDELRLTAELKQVADGKTVWSETFSAPRTSGENLENSMAMRIGNRVSIRFADLEEQRLVAADNVPPPVAAEFLTARRIWRKAEMHRRAEMIGLMERVISQQPAWGRAHATYAEILTASDEFDVKWDLVESTAGKAIELGSSLPQPFSALGEKHRWRDWDWKAAEAAYKKAIESDATYARSYYHYSGLLRIQRRFAEAEENILKAIEIEPFSPLYHSSLCELYFLDRKIEKAIRACLVAREIDPDYWYVKKLLYQVYLDDRRIEELNEMVMVKMTAEEREAHPLTTAIRTRDLRPFLRRELANMPSRKRPNPVTEAALYARLGENDEAIRCLEKALEAREYGFPAANVDPAFAGLRKDQRFVDLMSKIGR